MKCRQAARLISDAQERQLMTKESMPMQNDKMAVLCSSCTKV